MRDIDVGPFCVLPPAAVLWLSAAFCVTGGCLGSAAAAAVGGGAATGSAGVGPLATVELNRSAEKSSGMVAASLGSGIGAGSTQTVLRRAGPIEPARLKGPFSFRDDLNAWLGIAGRVLLCVTHLGLNTRSVAVAELSAV